MYRNDRDMVWDGVAGEYHWRQGMSIAEIAELKGETVQAIKSTLRRALKKLANNFAGSQQDMFIADIGRCWSCGREECPTPKHKKKQPEEGCAKWKKQTPTKPI